MNQAARFKSRIGSMLLNGPGSISTVDRLSHVAQTIAIRWASAHLTHSRSLLVFCDSSGSAEAGYLNPMARFASWDRETDVNRRESVWPNVAVELASLPHDSPDLNESVSRLQDAIDQPRFTSHGLITRRNYGDDRAIANGHLTIDIECGFQSLTRLLWVAAAPDLAKVVHEFEATVRKLAKPVNQNEWLEFYDHSPKEMADSQGWYWDGMPVESALTDAR